MTAIFRTGVRTLLALALLVPAAPGLAAEGVAPDPSARADLQRVLTQRIAKSYCQMGLGVAPGESTRQLLESVALFDLQMSRLRQAPLSGRERDSLAAMEQAWGPFRAVAMERVTRPGCETITRQSEELLRTANDLAREIRSRTGTGAGTLSSISGRQQVLAQKLAKLYMARAWGLDSAGTREEIDSARNEFSGALAKLQGAPENTAATKETLNRVALQWVWLDTALEQPGAYPSYSLVVADSSESIMQGMEAVTRLYQGAPGSRDRPSVGLPSGEEAPFGAATFEQVRPARPAVAALNRN